MDFVSIGAKLEARRTRRDGLKCVALLTLIVIASCSSQSTHSSNSAASALSLPITLHAPLGGEFPATVTVTTSKPGWAPSTTTDGGTITRLLSQKSVETLDAFPGLATDGISSIQPSGYYAVGDETISNSNSVEHCTAEDANQVVLPNPLMALQSWQITQDCEYSSGGLPSSKGQITEHVAGVENIAIAGKMVSVVRIDLARTVSTGETDNAVELFEPRTGLTVSRVTDAVAAGTHTHTTIVVNSLTPSTTVVKFATLGSVSLPGHWAADPQLAHTTSQNFLSLKGSLTQALRDVLTTVVGVTLPSSAATSPPTSSPAPKVGDTGTTPSGDKYVITNISDLEIGGHSAGFEDTTYTNPTTGALIEYKRHYVLRTAQGLLVIDIETVNSALFAPVEAALLSLPGSTSDNRAASEFIVAINAASAADVAAGKLCPSPQALDTNAQLTACARSRYQAQINFVQALSAINFPPSTQADVDALIQSSNQSAATYQRFAASSDVANDYTDRFALEQANSAVTANEAVVAADLNLPKPEPLPTPTSNTL